MTRLNGKTKGINILIYSYLPFQLEKHLGCADLSRSSPHLLWGRLYNIAL